MVVLSSRGTQDSPHQRTASRKRNWHSKVLTGCLKCKERHVKCDETKPGCLRCAKASLVCPGYRPPVARIFELPSRPRFDCDIDKANYQYFIHIGSAILTSFQLSAAPFWTKLAPQLGEEHLAVKHGLLALAAIQAPLHRSTVKDLVPNKRPELDPRAMIHTSKAMHSLGTAVPTSVPVDVALTCSILFLAMEIWVTKKAYSVVHVLAAHRILQGQTNRISPSIKAVFSEMVDELLVQTITFADDFPPPGSTILPDHGLGYGIERAASMSNWKGALDAMTWLLRCVLRGTSRHGSYVSMRDEISVALATFARKLEMLRMTSSEASAGVNDTDEYWNLRLHHRVACTMHQTLMQDDESIYDAFHADFSFILSQCESIIDRRKSIPADRVPNIRGPTLGLLPPLFFVATKCRVGRLRHRALKVMHDTLVNEREWTSCTATLMARFVVDQEEQHLNSVFPCYPADQIKARVRLLNADLTSSNHQLRLDYAICVQGQSCTHHQVILPHRPHRVMQVDGVNIAISKKELRACGYSGIILWTPPIECHCVSKSPWESTPNRP